MSNHQHAGRTDVRHQARPSTRRRRSLLKKRHLPTPAPAPQAVDAPPVPKACVRNGAPPVRTPAHSHRRPRPRVHRPRARVAQKRAILTPLPPALPEPKPAPPRRATQPSAPIRNTSLLTKARASGVERSDFDRWEDDWNEWFTESAAQEITIPCAARPSTPNTAGVAIVGAAVLAMFVVATITLAALVPVQSSQNLYSALTPGLHAIDLGTQTSVAAPQRLAVVDTTP